MTNSLKVSFGAVILLGSLMFVGIASAATWTNAEFGGNTEVYGNPSANKDVTLRIIVPAGEAVEYVETDIVSDGLAPVCHKVGGNSGLEEGTHSVKLPIKLPPLPGFYDLEVDGVGIFGAIRAVDCEDTSATHSTDSFSSVIRVIPTSANADLSGEGETGIVASLLAQIDALLKKIAALEEKLTNPPAPTKPAFCATRVSYNGSNAWAAQAWLLASGFHAPFNAIGVYAPTGNWLGKSIEASAQADLACK